MFPPQQAHLPIRLVAGGSEAALVEALSVVQLLPHPAQHHRPVEPSPLHQVITLTPFHGPKALKTSQMFQKFQRSRPPAIPRPRALIMWPRSKQLGRTVSHTSIGWSTGNKHQLWQTPRGKARGRLPATTSSSCMDEHHQHRCRHLHPRGSPIIPLALPFEVRLQQPGSKTCGQLTPQTNAS